MGKVDPKYLLDGLVRRGYTPAAAAGMVGNAAQESGFRTDVAGDGGAAVGLWQWNGPRKESLIRFANNNGQDAFDPDTQMDYLHHELSTKYKGVQKMLRQSDNPRQAAFAFSRHFERPNPKYANNAHRMGAAESFFKMINPIGTANADETPWQPDQVSQLHDEFAQWKRSQQPRQEAAPDVAALHSEFAQWKASQPKEKTAGQQVGEVVADIGGGVLKGASNIGNTLLSVGDAYNELVGNKYALSSLDSTGQERRQQATEGLKSMGVDTESDTYKAAELGAEIAGTAGTGGLLAKGAAKVAPGLADALASGGMKGATLAQKAAGGAVSGAAATGLVDPESALAGGAVGAVLPPGLQLAGKAGALAGKALKGKDVIPQATKDAGKKAIGKGFVIPPSQVRPSLVNRLLEGTAGKLTTAQNASAANQEVSNKLAQKAIGAESLTDEGLAAVRTKANKAYDALAKAGKFQADDTFSAALDSAAARTAKFKEDFPGLKNNDVDDLVDSLKSKGEYSADTTIEAIKRLRQEASANKVSLDASKKELGRVQGKVAGSLEDLVERNLEKSGDTKLLEEYRTARQTLAKAHSIEKATDKATGNLNAGKLAAEMQKGKPMTGELKDIAEFAQAFPKAAQNISKMGSLPQTSPLDVASVSTIAMMAGHPGYMALLALRPAARKAALSKFVQNRLVPKAAGLPSGKAALLAGKAVRAAPVAITQGGRE